MARGRAKSEQIQRRMMDTPPTFLDRAPNRCSFELGNGKYGDRAWKSADERRRYLQSVALYGKKES